MDSPYHKQHKPDRETLLQRRRRRFALLTLAGLLILWGLVYGLTSGAFKEILPQKDSESPEPNSTSSKAEATVPTDSAAMHAHRAYEAFVAGLHQAERNDRRKGGNGFPSNGGTRGSANEGERFVFDPNTADSITLCRLGLPGWMARNVLKYRQAGGRFRRAQDFRRIYGMTDERYQALEPYIRIADSLATKPRAPQLLKVDLTEAEADSLARAKRPTKYSPGTLVDLNRADTTELQRIPGIGSGIAGAIVAYRQELGGYCRIGQLYEISFSGGRRLDTTQLANWFTVDPTAIRRVNLNRAGIDRLRQHPYLNFYQAKAIVEARQREGTLTNLRIFALLDEFTANDLARLEPYVCFSEQPVEGEGPSQ